MIFIVRRHSKWGIGAKSFPKTTKNLKPGWGGILTEWFFAVRVPHSNWGGGIFGIRGGILTFILTVYIYTYKYASFQLSNPFAPGAPGRRRQRRGPDESRRGLRRLRLRGGMRQRRRLRRHGGEPVLGPAPGSMFESVWLDFRCLFFPPSKKKTLADEKNIHPLVIKRGSGKSPMNGGFNGKII